MRTGLFLYRIGMLSLMTCALISVAPGNSLRSILGPALVAFVGAAVELFAKEPKQ